MRDATIAELFPSGTFTPDPRPSTVTRMLAAQNPPPQANPAPVPAEPAGDTDKARHRASISDADGAEDRLRRADAVGAPKAPGDQPTSATLARRSVFRTLP